MSRTLNDDCSDRRDTDATAVLELRPGEAMDPDNVKQRGKLWLSAAESRDRALRERFGRFPHRNELLGRPSGVEEMAYLEDGGH